MLTTLIRAVGVIGRGFYVSDAPQVGAGVNPASETESEIKTSSWPSPGKTCHRICPCDSGHNAEPSHVSLSRTTEKALERAPFCHSY